jgi:hypothetical protein
MSKIFDKLSDLACEAHPTYNSKSFSEKARIYIEHYELRQHEGFDPTCPWCCAILALQQHRPEDSVQFCTCDPPEIVDLTCDE